MSDMAQKIGELKGKAEVKADEVKMKAGELKGKAEAKLDELKKRGGRRTSPSDIASPDRFESNERREPQVHAFSFEPQSVPHDAVGRSGPRFRAGFPQNVLSRSGGDMLRSVYGYD